MLPGAGSPPDRQPSLLAIRGSVPGPFVCFKVVAFTKSFHGRTSLAVAATDNPAIVAPVNQTENVVFLPFNDEAAFDQYFARHGEEISSVIVEGIQGVGGINEASAGFLQAIGRLSKQYGAIFIANSVQCGYGRSGKFFSHDHAGVDANIYTMAKGMGNGVPGGRHDHRAPPAGQTRDAGDDVRREPPGLCRSAGGAGGDRISTVDPSRSTTWVPSA